MSLDPNFHNFERFPLPIRPRANPAAPAEIKFPPFPPFPPVIWRPWTRRLPAECVMQAADGERTATLEVSMLMYMLPILSIRVSAGIRHNIAPDCQEPSVIAGQNNTFPPA